MDTTKKKSATFVSLVNDVKLVIASYLSKKDQVATLFSCYIQKEKLLLKVLTSSCIDINVDTSDGVNLLNVIVSQKPDPRYIDIDMIRYIFSLPDINLEIRDRQHRTVLMTCAERNHKDIVRALIEKGVDVNDFGPHRYTALLYAVEQGNTKIVHSLVEAGANVDISNVHDGDTALLMAANRRHMDIVKILIAHGAKLDTANKYQYTALVIASLVQATDISLALIEAGANLDIKDGINVDL